MSRKTSSTKHPPLLIAVGILALVLGSIGHAAKPGGGGGGGGGGAATGKIFYSSGGTLFSMNSDGSNKQQAGVYGVPNPTLHGGHRWFVERRFSDASFFEEYWLVRDDGVEHQLPIDADLEIFSLHWGPGGTLSGTGRRWFLDGTVDPGSCGLYVAEVAFDADGTLLGSSALVQFAHVGVVLENEWSGRPMSAARTFRFSPDLGQVVFDRWHTGSLWVLDVATGQARQIA